MPQLDLATNRAWYKIKGLSTKSISVAYSFTEIRSEPIPTSGIVGCPVLFFNSYSIRPVRRGYAAGNVSNVKVVPVSSEKPQLWAHSRCKRKPIGSAGAALVSLF